jgi:hypothetical protein
MAAAVGHLGSDNGGAGTTEGLVDRLTGRGVVLDRTPHTFDRLLRAVAGVRLSVRNGPYGALFAIPLTVLALPDGIPGWLVLPVLVAAADDEPGLVPDDLARTPKPLGSLPPRPNEGRRARRRLRRREKAPTPRANPNGRYSSPSPSQGRLSLIRQAGRS